MALDRYTKQMQEILNKKKKPKKKPKVKKPIGKSMLGIRG